MKLLFVCVYCETSAWYKDERDGWRCQKCGSPQVMKMVGVE